MNITKKSLIRVGLAGFFVFAIALSAVVGRLSKAETAYALGTDHAPSQAQCDSSDSLSYNWEDLGIDRPVVSSLTIGGEAITDFETPDDGAIGVAVCPNVAAARKVGVYVYYRDGMDGHRELSGQETPLGNPITTNTEIEITFEDLGELAQYYSFSLAYGSLVENSSSDLGTANAGLSVTLKPAVIPTGSGTGYDGCTATPANENCDPNGNLPSELDVTMVSLDMDFDQNGTFSAFTGAVFGITGAMGGFVQAQGPSLVATLGAPHFMDDGTTLNQGSLRAFLPNSVLENILGMDPGEVNTESLSVTRSAGDEESEAPFTVTAQDGGVIVAMSGITFSNPAYTIQNADNLGEDGGLVVHNPVSNSMMAMSVVGGGTIQSLDVLAEGDLEKQDKDYDYPLGLFDYTLSVPQGSEQEVTFEVYSDIDPEQVVLKKYNEEAQTYTPIEGAEVTSYMAGENDSEKILKVTYTVKDGGELDQDGEENGQIVDPAGVALSSDLAETGSPVVVQVIVGATIATASVISIILQRRTKTHKN